MKEGPDIARVAALIGDPARANMLTALMTGKALTATELAAEAGITSQTASTHLAKLDGGNLLRVRKQGRHKYFSLATDDVAAVLEGLMGLAAKSGHLRTRTGPRDASLRKARVCYNHLAGDMGIRMFDSFHGRGFLALEDETLQLTRTGAEFMTGFGIDLDSLTAQKSPLCRECLDWSARRSHLAGSLGRALLARIETLGWARRDAGSRAVLFTQRGEAAFADRLAVAPV
ncbi:winged helix-turn-helix domain-containing protein [Roseobacter sp.]|uniref:ArsR/SmtB family transcription factor n=1 Tax=Roseobacter sp. TaxID=1907202 RepID=UPI002965D62F|nr:winged helix-turn-helix domain-containing protein [Roseobacter sp.]MDW3181588.1 winged helix-turn-helix domain-containing protein [Roseobacter sp.]